MSFERVPLSGSIRLALEVFSEIQEEFHGWYEGTVRECEVEDCRAHEIRRADDLYQESYRDVQFFGQPYRHDVKKFIVTLQMASGYGNHGGKWAGHNWCCRNVVVVQVNSDGSKKQYEFGPSDR
jgi:hypothetical protein